MYQNPFIICLDSRIENSTSFFGRFQIGPIPEGHGLTIGNALRRILLSELETISTIGAKIELGNGVIVPHEYSSLQGVRESTLDLLFNLRELVFQTDNKYEEPVVGFIHRVGPTIVHAKDIQFSEPIHFVDPEQYIATINEEGALNIELILGFGKKQKSFLKLDSTELGLFSLEPSFNPINQVNYKIVSSFNENNDENIILEIITNGSIHPKSALDMGLVKLQHLFNSVSFNPLGLLGVDAKTNVTQSDQKQKGPILGKNISFTSSVKKRLCSLDIGNFNFNLLTFRELKDKNINTIGDLVFTDQEILEKKVSENSFREITSRLNQLGFWI